MENRKNIIICSDGTWQSPESDTATPFCAWLKALLLKMPRVTNRCSMTAASARKVMVVGGVTGKGIDRNIQDCCFVVRNYEQGDALYLFGFSRGAYTVRSLAGLIRNCGILRREHADRAERAYSLYRNRTPGSAPERKRLRRFVIYAMADVSRIHFIGVFDTVGALGIPAPFLVHWARATVSRYGAAALLIMPAMQ